MCLSVRALAPTSSCRSKAQRVCKIKSLGLSSDCRGQMHIVTGLNLQITGEHFVVKQNTIKAIYSFMMENDDPYVKFGVKMFVLLMVQKSCCRELLSTWKLVMVI